MPLLLRLKHWQAFLLLFVLPFLLQFGLPELFSAVGVDLHWATALLLDALPSATYMLWMWRVALHLYRRLPVQVKISPVYLHLGALYFVLYTLLFVYTLSLVKESVLEGNFPYGMLLLLAPMHLLATFCFLYIVYFAARSLVSVEQQQVVSAGAFTGAYLQFLFLPIGIWFLQPRLNKLPSTPVAL
ncbi:hypothetical protein ACFS7Z_06970 [Pontibacter toksunensis]|uniref:Uncharacterized protein n=1 Tax=Pontibacter toksunensis TaxID=1332631 RepID=A0ABW6BSL4_9BACT